MAKTQRAPEPARAAAPAGAPADRPAELPPAYDFRGVEARIYQEWLDGDLFRADPARGGRPFCIVIPPPNVTGSLHLGHALDNTVQDILVRWRRMAGDNVLWLPGTDHAGIATQYVVERRLAQEGVTRHDLGRERFLERVWAWKDEYEQTILGQLKRLGCSCDWSRTRFTMDPGLSRAVRLVFARLYERGLIYRGEYLVNWCPRCRTTLADLEVEHEERDGTLYFVRYAVDGGGSITVATTRPETILGDTAVAVHPEDARYRGLVGRSAILPVLGRRLPIIADAWVDREFGTGAVKVTPGHDPDDYHLGKKHGLEVIKAIDEDGRMTQAAGPYAGMDRLACRQALVERFREEGRLVEERPHRFSVGTCYRCDTVVEPLLSTQWFVKMEPLAKPAIAAVKDGRTAIVPEHFAKVYFHWLENIRDWPVSRQLWWGHRIPAWYCPDGHVTVGADDPEACATCGSPALEQDPDVLDTWFSSALWPFSTLGWPEDTADLRFYYPTSVLVTGYDILFFWVARMMFMGLEFMGEVPFRTVFLHGMVRDARGQRMSKTRGNVIDPLEVVGEHGADALRFALVAGMAPGTDMRLAMDKIEGARNFCNKLWNAARFCLMHLEGAAPAAPAAGPAAPLADRWILSRYARTVREATRLLEGFELGEAARVLHEFFWAEFCDWYIELGKGRLYGGDGAARDQVRAVLRTVLEGTLRLLHPFIPFVTEEVWRRLPGADSAFLAAAAWPEPPGWEDEAAEAEMAQVQEVIRAIRNLRAELGVPPARRADVVLHPTSDRARALLEAARPEIEALAAVGRLTFGAGDPPRQALAAAVPGAGVYLPLAGLVDVDRERQRLARELDAARADAARARALLANADFVARAPAAVVERERARLAAAEERASTLQARLEMLEEACR